MPDIYHNGDELYVSRQVRDAIEKVDDFGHQFYPVDVINKSGISIVPQEYFSLNSQKNKE